MLTFYGFALQTDHFIQRYWLGWFRMIVLIFFGNGYRVVVKSRRVGVTFYGQGGYFEVDWRSGCYIHISLKSGDCIGGDVLFVRKVFDGEPKFLQVEAPAIEFAGCDCGSKQPFQSAVIGTEGEVSSLQAWAEHQHCLYYLVAFAFGDVIVAFGIVEGLLKFPTGRRQTSSCSRSRRQTSCSELVSVSNTKVLSACGSASKEIDVSRSFNYSKLFI